MHFSTMNLDKAFLRIFRDLRVAPGGGLRQGLLVKEWSGVSLRRRDLDATIRRMTALCYLRQERTPEGEMLHLTTVGYEYAEQLFESPLQNLALQLRLKWNAFTRRGDITPSPQGPRRRIADRVSPTLT